MLKIAICDDDDYDRRMIKETLLKIQIQLCIDFKTFFFSSGEELLDEIENNSFNVIILDVFMKGIDGVETALKIRSLGEESHMIFISSDDKRFREFFQVYPVAFLDKPIETSNLSNVIERCLKLTKENKDRVFFYEEKGDKKFIRVNDIVYFESSKNKVIIQTLNEDITFYSTLSNVWNDIKHLDEFIMPHRRFIFNMKYVILKKDYVIIKKTKTEFKIGAKFKLETQERYFKFTERRFN